MERQWWTNIQHTNKGEPSSMSTLVQDILENNESISQTFKIDRNLNIAHIRPWIYIHDDLLDGDLQLEVLQSAVVLATKTINFADINAAKTDTYAHGWLRFDFDSLQLNIAEGNSEEEYIVRLTMINHTDSLTNFIAWSRDWEDPKYPVFGSVDGGGEAVNDMVTPFGLEIYAWESK